ncbi:Muscle-specific protein 300 kDa [Carabus blaptoides fortunei]
MCVGRAVWKGSTVPSSTISDCDSSVTVNFGGVCVHSRQRTSLYRWIQQLDYKRHIFVPSVCRVTRHLVAVVIEALAAATGHLFITAHPRRMDRRRRRDCLLVVLVCQCLRPGCRICLVRGPVGQCLIHRAPHHHPCMDLGHSVPSTRTNDDRFNMSLNTGTFIYALCVLRLVSGQSKPESDLSTLNFSQRNVVIFFTKPNIDYNNLTDQTGISFLKFPVTGCAEINADIPEAYRNVFGIDHENVDCHAMFNDHLMSLIDWATNVKHMVTATVSTTDSSSSTMIEKSFTDSANKFRGYEIYKYEMGSPNGRPPNRGQRGRDRNEPNDFNKDYEQLNPSNDLEPIDYLIPIIQLDDLAEFNEEPNRKSNEIHNHDFDLLMTPESPVDNMLGAESNVPQAKVLFNELTNVEKAPQLGDKSADDESSTFDGLLTKLREIFANSFFNFRAKRSLPTEENSVDPRIVGTVRVRPMFDLVRGTLQNLQTQTENHKDQTPGYLMVVLGGNLSEVADPFSDLVQSVKYVLENTDQDRLILVTCLCPDEFSCNMKREDRTILVPYYATGFNSDEIAKSRNMFDIFYNVRNSMKKKWSKYHGKTREMINDKNKTSHGLRTGNALNVDEHKRMPSPTPLHMQQCASPEYFRGVSPYVNSPELISYLPAQYRTPDPTGGYVGVPLEPQYRCEPDEHDGPSTADIIANQSQDYVDEKLAEYQATIQQLQGKRFI